MANLERKYLLLYVNYAFPHTLIIISLPVHNNYMKSSNLIVGEVRHNLGIAWLPQLPFCEGLVHETLYATQYTVSIL